MKIVIGGNVYRAASIEACMSALADTTKCSVWLVKVPNSKNWHARISNNGSVFVMRARGPWRALCAAVAQHIGDGNDAIRLEAGK